ncbi:hypothetical protein TKK_0017185 [Trichogramma kaykai]|uniref:Transcription factor CBF/NF-Y/archaeal histone domain-containing protein n=1 Tax=Trichogramma kaykai TaxID=54128 RepID=A0ABD2W5D7_9HYME
MKFSLTTSTPRTLELFVQALLTKTNEIVTARQAKTLSPAHMKQCIMTEPRFDFLKDLVKNIHDASSGDRTGPTLVPSTLTLSNRPTVPANYVPTVLQTMTSQTAEDVSSCAQIPPNEVLQSNGISDSIFVMPNKICSIKSEETVFSVDSSKSKDQITSPLPTASRPNFYTEIVKEDNEANSVQITKLSMYAASDEDYDT